jgi:hypothetical protein
MRKRRNFANAALPLWRRQEQEPQAKLSAPQGTASPVWQCTLQLPVLGQATRHAPVQVTLQLPTLSQVTTLPSPTVGAQSFTLWQS